MTISQLPGHDDECGDMKQARQEPQMMQMFEELHKIDVIKADGSKKCDFYRETEGYECVPYYQCNDGTIITDGEGLIDIRFGGAEDDQPQVAVLDSADLMCPGSLDVCCKDPDFIKPETEDLTDTGYGNNEELTDTGYNTNEEITETGYGGNEELTENEGDPYGGEVVDNDNNAVIVSTDDSSEEELNQEQREAGNEGGYGNPESSEEEDSEEDQTGRDNSEDLTEETGYNNVDPQPQKLVYQPQCGRRNFQGLGVRIQNYQDGESQFGEWPHMCAVLSREVTQVTGGYGEVTEKEILTFVAGASLIAPSVVMTGAIKIDPFM